LECGESEKMIKDYPKIKALQGELRNDGKVYDLYRCRKCGHVFTREEELEFYAMGSLFTPEEEREETICPCGSMKFEPKRPPKKPSEMLRKEFRRWRIWAYVGKLVLARWLAPKLEKNRNLQFLLPYIEKLV